MCCKLGGKLGHVPACASQISRGGEQWVLKDSRERQCLAFSSWGHGQQSWGKLVHVQRAGAVSSVCREAAEVSGV